MGTIAILMKKVLVRIKTLRCLWYEILQTLQPSRKGAGKRIYIIVINFATSLDVIYLSDPS